jgi:photosystem II stability/assembly factor-like uncharacterized protein
MDRGFDEQARSLTRRLIRAAEQSPTRAFEPVSGDPARSAAVLLATIAVVAGLIVIGTGVLHIHASPVATTRTPPPIASPRVSPTPEHSPTAASSRGIANLRMFTSSDGWAQRQSDGAILHTTQGVQRWTVASPEIGGQVIIAVGYVDADAARLITASPSALQVDPAATIQSWATNDGGLTWSREGTVTGYAEEEEPAGTLDFVNRDVGWLSITGLGAAGSSAIFVYRTVDSGLQWEPVDVSYVSPVPANGKLPGGCGKNPVGFLSASTGWDTGQCFGGPPFFYVSRNGGVTWKAQSIGLPWQPDGYTTSPVEFVDLQDGFMVGEVGLPGTDASLFVTTDGGITWVRRSTPIATAWFAYFVNAADGWMLDSDSDLYSTDDAGRTWTDLHVTTLGGLQFLTPQLGWSFPSSPGPVTGQAGFIETTDGGRTWSALTPTISG